MAKKEINLTPMTFLVADENDGATRLLNDILLAMGAKDVRSSSNYDTTFQIISRERIDVMICDYQLGKGRGPELIKTLRQNHNHPNRHSPILLTCSHTRLADIQSARDCGANMVIAKPFSVNSIYDRLAWIAFKPRPFVSSQGYCGPDRRFKDEPTIDEDRRGKAAEDKEQAA